MSRAVLDASAMLAFLRGEPGGDVLNDYRGDALASAVNVAEVGSRLSDLGASLAEVRRAIALISVEIVAFDAEQAYAAAGIAQGDARPISGRPRLRAAGGASRAAGGDGGSGVGGA